MTHTLASYLVGFGVIGLLIGILVVYHMIVDRPQGPRPAGGS